MCVYIYNAVSIDGILEVTGLCDVQRNPTQSNTRQRHRGINTTQWVCTGGFSFALSLQQLHLSMPC